MYLYVKYICQEETNQESVYLKDHILQPFSNLSFHSAKKFQMILSNKLHVSGKQYLWPSLNSLFQKHFCCKFWKEIKKTRQQQGHL